MDSNVSVFNEKYGIAKAVSEVLPIEKCTLFRDVLGNSIDKVTADFIVEKAEEYHNMDIPLLTLSLYRDYYLTGIRSNYEKFYNIRRNMLFYMVLAEAYERKGRFVEKIADNIWATLDEASWSLPAHQVHSPLNPSSQIPDVYREDQIPCLDLQSSQTAATLASAVYFLREELDNISPIICKRIEHLVYLRVLRPYMTVPYKWSGEVNKWLVNNWLTNITSCTLYAAAVFLRDFEERRRLVERAMIRLDIYTSRMPKDGLCDEGPGYWGAAAGNLFDCLEIIEDMTGGKITVYDHPLIRRLGEYVVKMNIDGKRYVNFADASPNIAHDGKMIARYGKKCASPEMESFGNMLSATTSVNVYYFYGMAYRVSKNLFTPKITEASKVKGYISTWFEDGKVAIFREGSDTSRGFYLAFKGGHNAESHNHLDVGCLVVCYNGSPVIVDPGIGSYDNGFFGNERYGRWYMKSSYHSVPSVDGIEQKVGKDYASTDEVFDAENKTVSMELKGAFPSDSGIEKMRRTAGIKGSSVVVSDEVSVNRKADICFNFLTVDEPRLIEAGKLSLAMDRVFEYDPSLEATVERVENTWLPYEDLNFKGLWGRECLWRIVLKTHSDKFTSNIRII